MGSTPLTNNYDNNYYQLNTLSQNSIVKERLHINSKIEDANSVQSYYGPALRGEVDPEANEADPNLLELLKQTMESATENEEFLNAKEEERKSEEAESNEQESLISSLLFAKKSNQKAHIDENDNDMVDEEVEKQERSLKYKRFLQTTTTKYPDYSNYTQFADALAFAKKTLGTGKLFYYKSVLHTTMETAPVTNTSTSSNSSTNSTKNATSTNTTNTNAGSNSSTSSNSTKTNATTVSTNSSSSNASSSTKNTTSSNSSTATTGVNSTNSTKNSTTNRSTSTNTSSSNSSTKANTTSSSTNATASNTTKAVNSTSNSSTSSNATKPAINSSTATNTSTNTSSKANTTTSSNTTTNNSSNSTKTSSNSTGLPDYTGRGSTFAAVFSLARSELGAGKNFTWNGIQYSTYYGEELIAAQQAAAANTSSNIPDYTTKATNYSAAFTIARNQLGAGKYFLFQNMIYSTNMANETTNSTQNATSSNSSSTQQTTANTTNTSAAVTCVSPDYSKYTTFASAFAQARTDLGAGKMFFWSGTFYSTYRKGEAVISSLNIYNYTDYSNRASTFAAAFLLARNELGTDMMFFYNGTARSTYYQGEDELLLMTNGTPVPDYSYACCSTFAIVFQTARKELGSGKMFTWNGMLYTTYLAEEIATPSKIVNSSLPNYTKQGNYSTAWKFARQQLGPGRLFIYNSSNYSTSYNVELASFNSTQFWNNLKKNLPTVIFWNTPFNSTQINNVKLILDACKQYGVTDIRQISYIMATIYLESLMLPIEEFNGAQQPYGQVDSVTGKRYYGRGFVQITYKSNYKIFADLLGVDLVNRPELALNAQISAYIAVVGMRDGLFTAWKLNDTFNDVTSDAINARRIINGLNKAAIIEGYHNAFLTTISNDKTPYV